MPHILNDVRRGLYLDSVALMRMSRTVAAMDDVSECGMMMGTPANKRIMADAGVLGPEGEAANPGDLVIAISANDKAAAEAGLAAARELLDKPKAAGAAGAAWAPRTIRAARAADPAANLALISVPGAFAAAEGRKALERGLNVLMFSDNVPIAEEVALKELARERGLLMMGPDCGTAIINGTPLGFANAVPRGDIGIIGASGTGIQEVSCLIANNGGGISHAIGVGGRDLKNEVGGITTLMAIDLLDADPGTRHIVIISKPPAKEVAAKVLSRVGQSKKSFTICFLGATDVAVPANAKTATTLEAAAFNALGQSAPAASVQPRATAPGKLIRGLFAGGTLCAEAQVVLTAAGLTSASNAAVPGHNALTAEHRGHTIIDLGDDAYTQGRPHPMIEPAVRDIPFKAALADPATGVILLDLVIGHGAHADPASFVVAVLADALPNRPLIVTSITGTPDDAQGLARQRAVLEASGLVVARSNAEAVRIAVRHIGGTFPSNTAT
jgi:FdrA protein